MTDHTLSATDPRHAFGLRLQYVGSRHDLADIIRDTLEVRWMVDGGRYEHWEILAMWDHPEDGPAYMLVSERPLRDASDVSEARPLTAEEWALVDREIGGDQ